MKFSVLKICATTLEWSFGGDKSGDKSGGDLVWRIDTLKPPERRAGGDPRQ